MEEEIKKIIEKNPNISIVEWKQINEAPTAGRLLITWSDKTKGYRICRYEKALTWKGWKYQFVNVNSKFGMWDEDATHWAYFPAPPGFYV